METVRLERCSFTYPGRSVPALENVDLSVGEGEFLVLCGRSGSGKSTLLRLLKPELSPHGALTGAIRLFGAEKKALSPRASAQDIGFLLQNTEYQTVTHTVRAELAFGLENLGLDDRKIRLRVAELAAYFSLEPILDESVAALSGGQKQLLCLAAVCAMHPRLLLLDEPTSQLDPALAVSLLDTVGRLCRENGITAILSEQRPETAVAMADRLLVLERGRLIFDAPPREMAPAAVRGNDFLNAAMPAATRIFAALDAPPPLPLTVAEGKRALEGLLAGAQPPPSPSPPPLPEEPAVELRRVRFSYDGARLVLRDLDLRIPRGTVFAIMGANAAGKSTALAMIAGLLPCVSGTVRLFGKPLKKYTEAELYGGTLALLPQKCEALFGGNTVREDLTASLASSGLSRAEKQARIERASAFCEITELLDTHPYDVSGGELQRAALAMLLMKNPSLLLLDEPTKGMDNLFKKKLAQKLRALAQGGATVALVTHDAAFAAEYCDAAALLFDGRCAAQADVDTFFSQNYFYTTAANKMARGVCPGAVREAQVIGLCQSVKKN